jgi:hypothetical protein
MTLRSSVLGTLAVLMLWAPPAAPPGAFLFSGPIAVPPIGNTDFLFREPDKAKP